MTQNNELSRESGSSNIRLAKGERGQILPLVAVMMGSFFCMCGFVIDMGRVYISYHQLLGSTDAAALAGGEAMGQQNSTQTTVTAAITKYSSQTTGTATGENPSGVMTTVTATPAYGCLSDLSIPCYGAGSYNAVQVTQTATVPMTFAKYFGASSVSLSATATAAMEGAPAVPYNVAIILDATLSQSSSDDNCGTTEMQCELNGVQVLLQYLYPCGAQAGNCTVTNEIAANPVDQVALFTFPAVTVGTVGIYTNCPTAITSSAARTYGYQNSSSYGYYSMVPETAWTGIPTATSYSFPTVGATSYSPGTTSTNPTYQVTPYYSDYRASDTTTTLNTNSNLVQALGGESGCSGMIPPNYDGDIGTYYAGVIYAAQASLVAQQANYPGSANAIILLSDGNATAPQSDDFYGTTVYPMPSPATSNGTYPSWNNECAQAVTAAQYAASQGTRVYAIAYGAETSGCTSDSSGISPCTTMKDIASSAAYFYSDYEQSGSGINRNCVGTGTSATSLNTIFQTLAGSFTVSRLIPNSTWSTNTL